MSNLKKILALVLALVMSMSVLTVASADFKDASTIDSKYAAAVDALAALEVFKGYEDGSFNPKGAITRAEVAAIIYRIDTSDIYDKQVKIYDDYNKFDDVASTAWYAGYVNYCANALYVKGYDETTFGPNDKVTGYQVLAMILRVVGYDQNNEFSGNAWQIEVAKYAQKLGITKNVTADTLGAPATRELVAELLYRTIVFARQVDYTLAFGYSEYADLLDKKVPNKTIEQEKIGMYKTDATMPDGYARDQYGALVPTTDDFNDIWGRPYRYWVAPKWFQKTTLADWSETPVVYYKAVVECELATVMGLKTTKNVTIYENGVDDVRAINPLHTNNHKNEYMIGEQGTLMEVYPNNRVIVLVDTYLAVVTDTVEQKTDKAGHIKVPATNDVAVFNADTLFKADGDILYIDEYEFAGNNYATGEYLLVNVYEGDLGMYDDEELYANAGANGAAAYNVFVLGNPDEMNAKQTKLWWNAEKHTIDGVEYDDNANYVLDAAQYDKNYAYRWFFDENGFVIGSTTIPTAQTAKQYAVVLGAQWMNSGVFAEKGYAYGLVQYLDGSEPVQVKLAGLWDGTYDADTGKMTNYIPFSYAKTITGDFTKGELHTTYQYNKDTYAHLYQVIESEDGLILIEVKTGLAEATLKDGVSQIDATKYYTDNETLYFFYNEKTGVLDMVKGYDNLNKNYAVENIDIVDGKFAAKFIYVPEYEEIVATKSNVSYGYYYITNDAMNYTLKDHFAVFGVVDQKGNTDPLLFAMNHAGNAGHVCDADCKEKCEIKTVLLPGFVNVNNLKGEELTEAYLEWFVETYQNKLVLVKFVDGVVDEMKEVVNEAGNVDLKYADAMFVAGGNYAFIETGVLKVYDGPVADETSKITIALNVNSNTVIINNDGIGELSDMEELEGNNLYVIYSGTTAIAVFVVPVNDGI